MYCSNCGRKNNDSAKFCAGCGSSLQLTVPQGPMSDTKNKLSEIKAELTEKINNLTKKQKTIIVSAASVVLIIMIVIFSSSCGAGASSPEALAQKYVDAINSDRDDSRDERILSCFLPELIEFYYNKAHIDDSADILNEIDGYCDKTKDYEMDIYCHDFENYNPYSLSEIGIIADQSATIILYIKSINGYNSKANLDICKYNGRWYIYDID